MPGGGGGGSGSPGAPGTAGGKGSGRTPGAGGAAGPGGGHGGAGGGNGQVRVPGTAPGGGGGGGYADASTYWQAGGNGGDGQLILTWTLQPAALTPVVTTVTSNTTTPHEYLTVVNTGTSHGLTNGQRQQYGWGIGYGSTARESTRYYGFSRRGRTVAPQIRVPFTTDGRTDYQIDATGGSRSPRPP